MEKGEGESEKEMVGDESETSPSRKRDESVFNDRGCEFNAVE